MAFINLIISCTQVKPIHPVRKEIIETVYASGKILPVDEYYAYALNSGFIVKKLVKEGALVRKGQVLYVINYDVFTARVAAAHSLYQNVQNNLSPQSRILNDLRLSWQSAQVKYVNDSLQYHRLKNLFEQGIGMKSTLDNAYTNCLISLNQKKAAEEKYYATLNELQVSFQNAKSGLATAEADLKNSYIRSTIDGAVYQTLKEAGEAVRPNEAVALIGASQQRIIKLAVDQQDINKVKLGQDVLLKTDVTGDTIYHATVQQIYLSMNETDQTFRVDAQFTGNKGQPYIHSSVEANIIVQKKKAALVIPRTALLANDSVQVREGRKLKIVSVQTGLQTPDAVEVLSGLNESSEIIVPSQK